MKGTGVECLTETEDRRKEKNNKSVAEKAFFFFNIYLLKFSFISRLFVFYRYINGALHY